MYKTKKYGAYIYRMSNNALCNHQSPPLMSDGRHFTDWRPNCDVEDLLMKQNGITNSYDMKMFLTRRADEINERIKTHYANKMGYHDSDYVNVLPDPFGHVGWWDRYGCYIGYNNKMVYDSKDKM